MYLMTTFWSAAYAWTIDKFEAHVAAMEVAKPVAIDYLRKHHVRIWSRSHFSMVIKVDYVTNNLAESFNHWIKDFKAMHLVDFMDKQTPDNDQVCQEEEDIKEARRGSFTSYHQGIE